MSINKAKYTIDLHNLKHCMRIIKDFVGKDYKITIDSDSVTLNEGCGIVLSSINDIAEYLDDTLEAYYNEP